MENESEQPGAANPEPEPEGPETNESVINESRASEGPAADDVTLSNTELTTNSNAATVTGTARNESDERVTIDLEDDAPSDTGNDSGKVSDIDELL